MLFYLIIIKGFIISCLMFSMLKVLYVVGVKCTKFYCGICLSCNYHEPNPDFGYTSGTDTNFGPVYYFLPC